MSRSKFQLLIGTLLGVALIASAMLFLELSKNDSVGGIVSGQVVTTGEAAIGGPFSLISHLDKETSNDDFLGKHMLIYFGYSFCPDVCPLELQRMALALDMLEDEDIDLDQLQPLFITIDPERDSAEILAQYVPLFHPRIMGLTGSAAEIAEAAGNYKVFYRKADDTVDYLMDHSSIIYLMGPQGKYLAHFTSFDSPEDIAARVQEFLE